MPRGQSYRAVVAVATAMFLAFASVAVAATEERHPEQAIEQAAVEVDGMVLFRVRGATSFPAEGRAAAIIKRIEAAARDQTVDPTSVRIGASEGFAAIFAGPMCIMVVTEADAQLEQLSVEALARDNERRIRSAIIDYRAARTPERVTRATLLTAGATLLYLGAAALLIWLTVRLRKRVELALHARIHTIGIQSFAILRAERIRTVVSALLRLLRILALLVLTFGWLVYVLRQFPWTVGVGNALLEHVTAALSALAHDFLAAIPNLIFLVVLYFILRFGLRLVRLFFDAVDRGTVKLEHFEPEWAMPTYKIVRLAIIVLGLVIAYPYIPGSDSAAFKGTHLAKRGDRAEHHRSPVGERQVRCTVAVPVLPRCRGICAEQLIHSPRPRQIREAVFLLHMLVDVGRG